VTVATTRNLHSALTSRIKSLNYLNIFWRRSKPIRRVCEEAIMLNSEGRLGRYWDNSSSSKTDAC